MTYFLEGGGLRYNKKANSSGAQTVRRGVATRPVRAIVSQARPHRPFVSKPRPPVATPDSQIPPSWPSKTIRVGAGREGADLRPAGEEAGQEHTVHSRLHDPAIRLESD